MVSPCMEWNYATYMVLQQNVTHVEMESSFEGRGLCEREGNFGGNGFL